LLLDGQHVARGGEADGAAGTGPLIDREQDILRQESHLDPANLASIEVRR
jgi:hypothetical protein